MREKETWTVSTVVVFMSLKCLREEYLLLWELSGQLHNVDRPEAEVEALGSRRCLQVVNIHQTKEHMCEISRTFKTNRGTNCDGGEGWEIYISAYRHRD